jgi:predicted alpha/beta hydrolase family esterase
VKLKVEVSANTQTVIINAYPGSQAERLYNKWYESQSDEDWEELLNWIAPDVADDMEIEITDVRN